MPTGFTVYRSDSPEWHPSSFHRSRTGTFYSTYLHPSSSTEWYGAVISQPTPSTNYLKTRDGTTYTFPESLGLVNPGCQAQETAKTNRQRRHFRGGKHDTKVIAVHGNMTDDKSPLSD